MAKSESDREDLLREATALVERMEVAIDGQDEPWTVGFRANGAGSLFAGVDPVFQFNPNDELRRVYWRGDLLKADQGRLIRLRRHRTAGETQLLRSELSDLERQEVLAAATAALSRLATAISSDSTEFILRLVAPPGSELPDRARRWAAGVSGQPIRVAARPHANG